MHVMASFHMLVTCGSQEHVQSELELMGRTDPRAEPTPGLNRPLGRLTPAQLLSSSGSRLNKLAGLHAQHLVLSIQERWREGSMTQDPGPRHIPSCGFGDAHVWLTHISPAL